MDLPEFSPEELRVIGRLAQNLLGCALDAGDDPGLLMSIYNKTQDFLDVSLDNSEFVG
jgi:hypothetical protein